MKMRENVLDEVVEILYSLLEEIVEYTTDNYDLNNKEEHTQYEQHIKYIQENSTEIYNTKKEGSWGYIKYTLFRDNDNSKYYAIYEGADDCGGWWGRIYTIIW